MFSWETQVRGQALEVLGKAGDGTGVGALPLGPEAVHPSAGFGDGRVAWRLLDLGACQAL
jgi:hypothetical protein